MKKKMSKKMAVKGEMLGFDKSYKAKKKSSKRGK